MAANASVAAVSDQVERRKEKSFMKDKRDETVEVWAAGEHDEAIGRLGKHAGGMFCTARLRATSAGVPDERPAKPGFSAVGTRTAAISRRSTRIDQGSKRKALVKPPDITALLLAKKLKSKGAST